MHLTDLAPVPSPDDAPEDRVAEVTVCGCGVVVLLKPVGVTIASPWSMLSPSNPWSCLALQQELYGGPLVDGPAVVPGVHAGSGDLCS